MSRPEDAVSSRTNIKTPKGRHVQNKGRKQLCVHSMRTVTLSLIFLPLSLKFSSIQKYHLADVALVIQLTLLVVTILKHTAINPSRVTNIELC